MAIADAHGSHDVNHPRVAVFDADLAPGVAFLRSLGRRDVPLVVYSDRRNPVGRFSRYASQVRPSPNVRRTDDLIGFIEHELNDDRFDVVAPTSDYVVFGASQAFQRLHLDAPGLPDPDRLNACLFKARFESALRASGFPTPTTAAPLTVEDAMTSADVIGFPLVLKPRSHVGIGLTRGLVVDNKDELERAFRSYQLLGEHSSALAIDGHLALPLMQSYFGDLNVVSVTGVLGRHGDLLAVGHCAKRRQWPPRLGIGTYFDAQTSQPFTDSAIDMVRDVLGCGIFELEVLTDPTSGEYWAIDLNPRGFGQMSLDMANGSDLPWLWFSSVVGDEPSARPIYSRSGTWRMGVHYYTEVAVDLVRGPQRMRRLSAEGRALMRPSTGPIWDLRDPLPGAVWAWRTLRHAGSLVRPFVKDTERINPSRD